MASVISVIRFLPHRAALAVGAFLGTVLWALGKRKVDKAEARCVSVLGIGITHARKIIRASYANMGRSAVEFARMGQLQPRLNSLVSIQGKEYLDEALSRGKGVLFMTAHIGNWELAGSYLAAQGYSMAAIYTPQRNRGGVEDLIRRQRAESVDLNMIPSEGFGLREAFRALRKGSVLTFLQDLDARKEGVLVPFLGLPASTAAGIVKMYQKFGSPVVGAVTIREPDNCHHRIYVQGILSDLSDEDGAPFGSNMEKSLQICNNILGDWVKKYPEQWMWLLDRWESVSRL